MDCGCKIVMRGEGGHRDRVIEFCPLHAAAWELLAALQKIESTDWVCGGKAVKGNTELPWCEEFYKGYNCGIEAQFFKTARIAQAAIKKAQG